MLKRVFFARSFVIFSCLQFPRPAWPFKDKLTLTLVSVFLELITTVPLTSFLSSFIVVSQTRQ